MRKKTYADIVLEAQMLPYSQEGYSFYKEAAELGLRGKYLENLLYKESHRDILEAQELMLQESFFAESTSASDFQVLVEQADAANQSFLQRLFGRVLKFLKTIGTLISNYNEHAKQNKEKVDQILQRMRALGSFDKLSISQEELLKKIKTLWASKGDMGESAEPAAKQEMPGAIGNEELKRYIAFGMAQNYVNVVIEPSKRFSGVISLEDMKELLTGLNGEHPDYAALNTKYDQMAKKASEGNGIKVTLVDGMFKEIQNQLEKWVQTVGTAKVAKPAAEEGDAKTESTMDDLLLDEEYMEQVMLLLEDASSASAASTFGQRLMAATAKYTELMRCVHNYKNAFLPFFLGVLDGKESGSSTEEKPAKEEKKEEPKEDE